MTTRVSDAGNLHYQGPISIVCVLYEGHNVQSHSMNLYEPEWVNRLYRGFNRNLIRPMRFVCITDFNPVHFRPGIEIQPFIKPNRDYFSTLEAFRPDLELGRTLLTGLDTVITGSMEQICSYDGSYGLIRNRPVEELRSQEWIEFYPRVRYANGLVMYDAPMATAMWWIYNCKPHEHWDTTTVMPGHTAGSEMVFMCEQAPCEPDALDELYPGQIVSFRRTFSDKQHLDNERLVYFHGSSKPNLVQGHPIVRDHWT